jgi:hypothetical protein
VFNLSFIGSARRIPNRRRVKMRRPRWIHVDDDGEFTIIVVGPDAPAWAQALNYANYLGMEWLAREDKGWVVGCKLGLGYYYPDFSGMKVPDRAYEEEE